ncbi:sensor histidine kinase [Labilibaculum sp.]|uniref:sensor histidine kinase n=1 Tax=Labilibaculum sp. TaxID=2060723 RepID=UPI00356A34B7
MICEEKEIHAWIDRDKFDKILYNLLSNAIKFTGKYGNVDLFVGLKDSSRERLVIEVSDDGIGIPLESQKKIFSRFYQAKNGRADNTGSGIGLSLVKSLVKLHKASIKVESVPSKGSLFALEIPINKSYYTNEEIFDYELKANENQLVVSPVVNETILSTHLKEKLLIIEGNAELRKWRRGIANLSKSETNALCGRYHDACNGWI